MANPKLASVKAPYQQHASGTFSRAPMRRVYTVPNPVLSTRAPEVDPLDPAIVALSDALVTTMRASPACVGLAATQVGEGVRLFCMDITGHKKARSCAGLVVLANPRIVAQSAETVMREGCMSVPHFTGNVARAAEVTVEGYEPGTGRVVRIHADAMEARCLQHEIDHLDGLVFVDRVRDRQKDLFARKSYA
jgi:peptide deformylase